MSFDALLSADFKTSPWHHQLREFEISADLPARALLWQMRTGKTKFTLDTASHLARSGAINTVLIFAPNGVHANWLDRELPLHLWEGIDHHALAWRSKVAGLKGGNGLSKADQAAWEDVHAEWWRDYERALRSPELSFVAFNNESVTRKDVRKALAKLAKRRRVLAIWDESSDYRSPGSARTKMMRALAKRCAYRRILDGTAVTNSPLHAFAQFNLLEDGALGYTRYADFEKRYGEFEERYNRTTGRTYRKLIGFNRLEELRDRIGRWSSVVLRTDCVDLPDVHPRRVKVPMSPEQRRVYTEVEKQIRIEIARGEVATIGARTVKLMKLQQVVGGFLIDEDRKAHRIPGENPRLEALSDEVFYSSGRVIVWCQFHEELDMVAARLRADGRPVMEYHGRVPDAEKARVRREFPKAPRSTVLVAQPQSAGRGIELPADLIVWYSHTFNAIIRQQANERATVMGGKNVELVDFVAPLVDPYILDKLESKVDIADDVAGRGLQAVLDSMRIGG